MNRDKLIAKIRALLAKTEDAGCTEDEALAAAAKAADLMDKYHVERAELESGDTDFSWSKIKPQYKWHCDIYHWIAPAIAKFTGTVPARHTIWHGGKQEIRFSFFGETSDALFARWLCSALSDFVLAGAKLHPKGLNRKRINLWRRSYMAGAGFRISERLNEITAARMQAAQSSGTALTLADRTAVANARLEADGPLGTVRAKRLRLVGGAYEAGRERGDCASFDKPLGSSPRTAGLLPPAMEKSSEVAA